MASHLPQSTGKISRFPINSSTSLSDRQLKLVVVSTWSPILTRSAWGAAREDSTPAYSTPPRYCGYYDLKLTSRSGSTPSPYQDQGEISPGKNAILHCTAAGFTPLRLGHERFTVLRSVALMQLRFTSFAMTNS